MQSGKIGLKAKLFQILFGEDSELYDIWPSMDSKTMCAFFISGRGKNVEVTAKRCKLQPNIVREMARRNINAESHRVFQIEQGQQIRAYAVNVFQCLSKNVVRKFGKEERKPQLDGSESSKMTEKAFYSLSVDSQISWMKANPAVLAEMPDRIESFSFSLGDYRVCEKGMAGSLLFTQVVSRNTIAAFCKKDDGSEEKIGQAVYADRKIVSTGTEQGRQMAETVMRGLAHDFEWRLD
jgi:hypothetical protein